MKEQIERHVKNVKEFYSHCVNEAMTKASLIAPLFTILGWDLTHPKECHPEYRVDYGYGEKAATPMDWMFSLDGPAFIVEAKATDKKLKTFTEQLAMYFAKTSVKLGVISNGIQWRFYTDLDKDNIMDKEPFLVWDLLQDQQAPLDFLTILRKEEFKPQLIKTYAERGRKQNLLVDELSRILTPSSEFVKMAIHNIESSQKITEKIIEQWKPILSNAIESWVRLKALDMALDRPSLVNELKEETEKPKSFKGKTCPSCQKSGMGYRTRICKCGHVFYKLHEEPEEEPVTIKINPQPAKLEFSCNNCGEHYSQSSEFAGRTTSCRKCNAPITIPSLTQVS